MTTRWGGDNSLTDELQVNGREDVSKLAQIYICFSPNFVNFPRPTFSWVLLLLSHDRVSLGRHTHATTHPTNKATTDQSYFSTKVEFWRTNEFYFFIFIFKLVLLIRVWIWEQGIRKQIHHRKAQPNMGNDILVIGNCVSNCSQLYLMKAIHTSFLWVSIGQEYIRLT